MKTQHTPGPWAFRPQNYPGSRHLSHYEIRSGNDMVATGAAHLLAAEANARLIASAPTMFDYLTLLASRGNDEAHEIIKKITGP